MKTIYFVRHGLTDTNVAGLSAGGELESILTPEGREQAKRAGRDLSSKNIDLIVCSPMKRALETAELIARELGIDKKLIKTNPDFVERFMGEYSGKSHLEYQKDIDSGTVHESVESSEALKIRVERGINWLKSPDGNNIVLVSHGATGRMVKLIDQGLSHEDMYKIDGFKNTDIYEFKV